MQRSPSEAIQILENSFLLHKEKMKKVMSYLDSSHPEKQKQPVLYHRFSGANPLLRPFYKITQAWQAFYRRGFLTGIEDERADLLRYLPDYKCPEQIYLEKLISDYYQTLGITGNAVVSTEVIASVFDNLCRHLLRRGDVIISTSPIYGHFFNVLDELKAKLYLINTNEETGFKFTPAQLRHILETVPDATAFLLIQPDNPTGVYYNKEELSAFSAIFIEFNSQRKRLGKPDLIVIVDEVICNLTYSLTDASQNPFTHFAAIPGMNDFTVTLTSLSKDHSPEYACAIMVGPPALTKLIKPHKSVDRGKLISIAEVFLPANRDELNKHLQRSMNVYKKNLMLLKQQIELFNSKLAAAVVTIRLVMEPAAGFQVLIQINGLLRTPYPQGYKPADYASPHEILSSLDFAAFFRDHSKVELVPGEGFNLEGNLMLFRMSISKTPRQIKNFFKYLVDTVLALKPDLSPELRMQEITKNDPADNELIDYRYLAHSRMLFTTATRGDYFEEVSPIPEQKLSQSHVKY